MSYKISKELFEAVYGRKVDEHTDLRYKGFLSTLVVNDFFFKCKEWLIGRGYDNWSGYHENEYFCFIITKGAFISTSEQQSVFDACQWVLDNKEK